MVNSASLEIKRCWYAFLILAMRLHVLNLFFFTKLACTVRKVPVQRISGRTVTASTAGQSGESTYGRRRSDRCKTTYRPESEVQKYGDEVDGEEQLVSETA